MEWSDEEIAESAGLGVGKVKEMRKEYLTEGLHFERRHATQGGGVWWNAEGLQVVANAVPLLSEPLLSLAKKTGAPGDSAQAVDPAVPAPAPAVEPSTEPVELIATKKLNDNFFKAVRADNTAVTVTCRHRRPDLFPPNFRFHASPAPGNPNWWLPVKTPRWKGKW